ncbi:hypothetical protein BSL78_19116 [Apostichopus japonicus]|uniref:Immunoglobulin-like beta-sandwich domain-containing protein n=1 Tax=Stichopus japonicus TaxID=307972 RepID=A0A2G8K7N3_STIJA|nr:hypothetical protein BSL78_19116 [Apostichopus japonicus]
MDEVTISCRNRFNGAQLSGDTRMRKDGEDTHGERSDDTSVFRLVIINPTAEDSGIYTCLSSGLSHSISVAFEETPVCSSPTTNPHVIALVGENNLPIASRVLFSEGERLAFLCEDDMTLVGANSIECIKDNGPDVPQHVVRDNLASSFDKQGLTERTFDHVQLFCLQLIDVRNHKYWVIQHSIYVLFLFILWKFI